MKFVEAIKILNCWEYFMFSHKNQNSDPSLMKQVSNTANSCKLNPKEGRDQRNTKTAGFQPNKQESPVQENTLPQRERETGIEKNF